MTRRIELARTVERALRKLDEVTRTRVLDRIDALSADPIPPGSKSLGRNKGERIFRIRIGAYRVIYKVRRELILVFRLDHRRRAYQHFRRAA